MSVDAVLERLMLAYRAPDVAGLALCLGMDELTFRVWRSRKKVPDSILVRANRDTGFDVNWFRDENFTGVHKAGAANSSANFFAVTAKQVKLNSEEKALLDNFRAASNEGRLAITAASAALAKPNLKGRKAA